MSEGEIPEVAMGGPRIILTWSPQATRPADRYLDAVIAAGGVPLLVLPVDGLADLRTGDGLVLAGGRDVHPARYGQQEDPRAAGTLELDETRDQYELDAIAFALEHDLPILGICRGIQVLNVALGGSLCQDIPSALDSPLDHSQKEPRHQPTHHVKVREGSRLAAILGTLAVDVNSFHHQALKALGRGLTAVAWAPDGIVEGAELADAERFVVGVQWHPEDLVDHDPAARNLFAALVRAAASRLAD